MIELFLHVAPDADPNVQLDPKLIPEVIPSLYCTGFNASLPNRTVIGRWSGDGPVRFETRIDLSGSTNAVTSPLEATPVKRLRD